VEVSGLRCDAGPPARRYAHGHQPHRPWPITGSKRAYAHERASCHRSPSLPTPCDPLSAVRRGAGEASGAQRHAAPDHPGCTDRETAHGSAALSHRWRHAGGDRLLGWPAAPSAVVHKPAREPDRDRTSALEETAGPGTHREPRRERPGGRGCWPPTRAIASTKPIPTGSFPWCSWSRAEFRRDPLPPWRPAADAAMIESGCRQVLSRRRREVESWP
jgi:hypothetical protein